MRSDSCFAGYSAYRYISVYLKMGVFFANTGSDARRVRSLVPHPCSLPLEPKSLKGISISSI